MHRTVPLWHTSSANAHRDGRRRPVLSHFLGVRSSGCGFLSLALGLLLDCATRMSINSFAGSVNMCQIIHAVDLQHETIDLQNETIDLHEETINLQEETIDLHKETIDLQRETQPTKKDR